MNNEIVSQENKNLKTSSKPGVSLTPSEKKNLRRIWWRSGVMMGSMNAIKKQGQGYCYSMIPIINELYKDKPLERIDALKRSNQFMNSHACTLGFIQGINYALEKEKAETGKIEGGVITNLKTSLMGPLAGVGDSIFFNTIRVIAAGIGISYASQGNILGALIFLLIYGGSFLSLKYYLIRLGYTLGTDYLGELFEKGWIKAISKCASILGLMMVGCMTANLISVSTPLVLKMGGASVKLQSLFDGIMPKGLSLLTLFVVYKLLKKGHSAVKVVFLIIGFCILMAALGVFW
jgi:mannose/fructose/N-acetylgalactosamine-specific phosphotransferase system component IID